MKSSAATLTLSSLSMPHPVTALNWFSNLVRYSCFFVLFFGSYYLPYLLIAFSLIQFSMYTYRYVFFFSQPVCNIYIPLIVSALMARLFTHLSITSFNP